MLYSNWFDKECILISVWGLVQCLLSSKWKKLIGKSGWKFENDFSLAVNNICVNLFYFRYVPLSSRTTALHDLYSVHRINCDLCFDRETDWKIGYMNCDLEKHPDYFTKGRKTVLLYSENDWAKENSTKDRIPWPTRCHCWEDPFPMRTTWPGIDWKPEAAWVHWWTLNLSLIRVGFAP